MIPLTLFSTTSITLTVITLVLLVVIYKYRPINRVKHFATLLSAFLFLSTSCTSYISLIDTSTEQIPLKAKSAQNYSCTSNNAIASHSKSDNDTLLELFKNERLSLEEELIMSILQQMAVRPATTSASARLQVGIIDTNGKWQMFDYYRPAPELSLWQGLYDLVDKLKLKPLAHYLGLAKKYFPNSMEIGSPFAQYLYDYRQELSESPQRSPFFKAGQILKSGESIPTPNWSNLPKHLGVKKEFKSLKTPIFKSHTIENTSVECNFDIDLYSKSVYLIRPHPGVNYNAILRAKGQRAFIFISSVELEAPKSIQGISTFLQQTPALRPIPLCFIKNSESEELMLTSLRGRDPGQHLYHMLQYSISQTQKIEEVETYIASARHQFLYEPARMLYESSRATGNNLETFLRMDFPIYHVPSLGEVWGWGKFSNGNGLAIDERSESSLSCQ